MVSLGIFGFFLRFQPPLKVHLPATYLGCFGHRSEARVGNPEGWLVRDFLLSFQGFFGFF